MKFMILTGAAITLMGLGACASTGQRADLTGECVRVGRTSNPECPGAAPAPGEIKRSQLRNAAVDRGL
jgi:hypothetical protein